LAHVDAVCVCVPPLCVCVLVFSLCVPQWCMESDVPLWVPDCPEGSESAAAQAAGVEALQVDLDKLILRIMDVRAQASSSACVVRTLGEGAAATAVCQSE
jgi:hypothetical protein